ncbi:MAG: ABC transporter permease [candidate division KSB1 bacterium]|nr:ABC transporter permease [candidate division KSB1 bacterium]MDZ7274256.1 ABC transporter permease [candidate division KSB1 bacterium]MDZ7287222.1 ABC transporter permease [candidate division KSB1 bacterium]MDZ7296854.1 ABC transporter permease [candidate division KSB1 bacterium]MDZ7306042.1 ABC transporter permease [candidate division KSB1 bacterium]
MMVFTIALRNVFRQKRRTVLTALTLLGGMVLSALSIGLTDGTYATVIDLFTRTRLGHIQVHAAGYLDNPTLFKTIADFQRVGGLIAKVDGVEGWAPRLYSAGLVAVGEKSAGAQIIGIDPRREVMATHFHRKIIAGRNFTADTAPQAMVGRGLAQILQAKVGDEIVVVSQAADGSLANALYSLVGIIDSGDELNDRMAFYLPLAVAQELLMLPGRAHEIVVIVSELERVRPLAQEIAATLADPALAVAPWQEFARPFYEAMQMDQRGNWISLSIILLIVAIGVLNTVLMSVLERTREYGLLKAVGTRPAQIFTLVISEINVIAVAGIMAGAALSLILNAWLSRHGIALPQSFTFAGVEFTTMYATVNWRSILLPAVTVLLVANLASLFPSLKAARVAPARAMRLH